MYLTVCIVLLGLLNSSQCMMYNMSQDLFSYILTGYNVRQRPVLNQTDMVNISVSLHVASIRELDEVTGKFSVLGLLQMTWTDQMISWTPLNYDGAMKIDLKLSDIWYPKIVLANPYSQLEDLGKTWMMIFVMHDGSVSFGPGSLFETTCKIDVTYYPFDTQECFLQFVAWGHDGTEVGLYPLEDQIKTSDFMENGEWQLQSTDVVRNAGNYQKSDKLVYKFTIKRRSLYLVTNIVLPILFMSCINVLVFILPAESGERLSFSVTVLLALAVYMTLVGENLPKTSDPMSILGFYLLTILLVSTFITVTTIINLEIYHRNGEVSNCYKSFAKKIRCSTCKRKDRNTAVINIKLGFVTEKVIGSNEAMPEVTWHNVSSSIDRICLSVFSLVSVLVHTAFLFFLKNN